MSALALLTTFGTRRPPAGEPPVSEPLAWAPPEGWEEYEVRNISTSGGVVTLDDAKDYRVVLPETPVTQTLTIKGGRNVVVMGGEVKRDGVTWDSGGPGANEANQSGIRIWRSDDDQARIDNNGRIVHIEGVLIHGYYLSDPFIINAAEADVRIQNCRGEQGMWYRDSGRDGVGSPHGDIIQPWGGVGWLRVDGLTGLVASQGMMLKPDSNGPNQGSMSFRRVNLRGNENPDIEANDPEAEYPQPSTNSGPRYLWWTNGEEGTHISIEGGSVWFNHPSRSFAGGNVFWPQGYDVDSDGIGTYAVPPGAHDEDGVFDWEGNPGGRIYEGTPPGGDYVPANTIGIGYVNTGGYDSDLQPADPDIVEEPPEPATVSIVGGDTDVAFGVSVSVEVPATAQANDLALVFVSATSFNTDLWIISDHDLTEVTPLLPTGGAGGFHGRMALYSAVVGVDVEPEDVITVGEDSNRNWGAHLVLLRSSDGSVPEVAEFQRALLASPGDDEPTAPALTFAEDGLLFYSATVGTDQSSNSHASPSGYTDVAHVQRQGISHRTAYKAHTSGTSSAAAGSVATSGPWAAMHVLVTPGEHP